MSDWITFEAMYQTMLRDEPHLSRARFRERWLEHVRRQAPPKRVSNSREAGDYTQHGARAAPATNLSLKAVTIGWNDLRAGLAPRKAYEDVPRQVQQNYEMGRAIAVIVRRHQELPEWPDNKSIKELYDAGLICDAAVTELIVENKWFNKDMEVRDADNQKG